MNAGAPPPSPLPALIAAPSAWLGAALAKAPATWTYRLSAAERAEIDAARTAVIASGMSIADIRRRDFPLPKLGATLDGLRQEVLDGRGFVLIRGLQVEGRTMNENAVAFLGVGSYFGNARSQNAKGHVLGHVRDLGLSTSDPNVRTYQTTERQNFHTDSSDIVGLLCLTTAKQGGLSSLTSSMTIYNRMARSRPDLAQRLFLPVATDRRGEVPTGKKGYFEIPVFNYHRGLLSAIYDRRYIQSAQRFADARRLTDADLAALDCFDGLANDAELRLDMEFHPGDMQFLNNHVTVHDRTAYVDWDEPERKRHLLRLWLAPDDARPLPDVFAERYGGVTAGDRGGVICPGTTLHAPLRAE